MFRWTPEKESLALKLRNETSLTQAEIAARVGGGCDQATVSRFLKKNVSKVVIGTFVPELPEVRILDLYDGQAMTCEEIADEVGVSFATVQKVVDEYEQDAAEVGVITAPGREMAALTAAHPDRRYDEYDVEEPSTGRVLFYGPDYCELRRPGGFEPTAYVPITLPGAAVLAAAGQRLALLEAA